jgi:hypothetical protein
VINFLIVCLVVASNIGKSFDNPKVRIGYSLKIKWKNTFS